MDEPLSAGLQDNTPALTSGFERHASTRAETGGSTARRDTADRSAMSSLHGAQWTINNFYFQ
jgi:hypothetical protein